MCSTRAASTAREDAYAPQRQPLYLRATFPKWVAMTKSKSSIGERSFPFLRINERKNKPRKHGLTEIRGPYYSVVGRRYLEDLLETMVTFSGRTVSCSSAALVRRSAFGDVGGFDERLGMSADWDFLARNLLMGRLAYVDERGMLAALVRLALARHSARIGP